MLVYRQNEIPTSPYFIYTISYANLKWHQYKSENSKLFYADNDRELTACTNGKLAISSIYISTLDGWARWTGSNQNIFKLEMNNSSYSIKVLCNMYN